MFNFLKLTHSQFHGSFKMPLDSCFLQYFNCFYEFTYWKNLLITKTKTLLACSESCLTLCDPMDCSTTGLPVHHQLPESTQTHVHWISDAIQPSYPLLSPSPPTFNLSQYQGFFKWVSFHVRWPQYWGFSFNICSSNEYSGLISFRLTNWISLQSKRLSKVFPNARVQKHQFFGAKPSSQSISHIHTWPQEKP